MEKIEQKYNRWDKMKLSLIVIASAKRAAIRIHCYNLRAIKVESAGGSDGKKPTTPFVGEDSTTISIAEMYNIVKTNDIKFTAGSSVDENLLNADGTPKVMYRGGTETINIFDRRKSRASNLYGRGFYFTEDKNAAARYGEVREYYLRIEHPLTPGKHTLKKEQYRRFLSAEKNRRLIEQSDAVVQEVFSRFCVGK